MLRKDIINGFQQVLDAINECDILTTLEKICRKEGGDDKDGRKENDLIMSFRKWACASEKFNEPARSLLDILEMKFIDDPKGTFWVYAFTNRIGVDDDIFRKINFFVHQIPSIIQLIDQDISKYTPKEVDTKKRKQAILSVLIVEEDAISTPARISILMESVKLLYEVCAEINNISSTDLTVIRCDSGSDKSFDFLGAAKVIEQVRKIILDMWDRVVFNRERKLDARLDLLSKSLPIIEHIDSLEKNQTLGREQAEKMRRNVCNGVNNFFESGTVIPEMENISTISPRKLMAPQTKLLVSNIECESSEEVEKDEVGTKVQEHKKPLVDEDPKLKNYVEKVVKEVLEKEQDAKEFKEEKASDGIEQKEGDKQTTDSDNNKPVM